MNSKYSVNTESTDNPRLSHGETRSGFGRVLRVLIAVIALYVLVVLGLAFYWNRPPATLDLSGVADEAAIQSGARVPGSALVATAIGIGETLLDKPGGFLYNDITPPGVFLDNMPSWECGNMMALRDFVRSLRNDFSRSQSQSYENEDLKQADLHFAIDPNSWMLPTAEVEYRKGIASLKNYLDTLNRQSGGAGHFFARADNLASYLNVIEKRLGHQGSRLRASVADPALVLALAPHPGDAERTPSESLDATRTPWNEIDDVFYCSRGYSWALLHIMQAIEVDFREILEAKGALTLVQRMTRDLRGAIRPMASPIILSGDGYGILANHSLTIASYISRVNATILDLRNLLKDG
ncbi:hypothetical protein CCR95_01665 [Thiocystis minor]|uniref:DUF2333 family protein n=1 Tax=Thiocystis minor TaxID=61597 RepID=UPI0019128426|nr:DUF2333 family protein [Thiocystis minor]MBK5962832.1 hypothetical protein [Thiocystis minor]